MIILLPNVSDMEKFTSLVLSNCFPELNVHVNEAKHVPYGYWKDQNNQRSFIDAVAKKLSINGRSFCCL